MTTPDPRGAPDARPAAAGGTPAEGGDARIDAAEADTLPTSFGVYMPVGHVMTGLPTQAQVDALVAALRDAGWPAAGVRPFLPADTVAGLRAMVDNAGPLAGFGYEITLLRRYLALAEEGTQWLLIQADDNERAAQVAAAARRCGATMAVFYRTLTVEELIW